MPKITKNRPSQTENVRKKATLPKVVREVGQLPNVGNVIPHSWYTHIVRNGHADMIAIVLLAEIVYWYRPTKGKTEADADADDGPRKKFKADKLQFTYNKLGKKFNLGRSQVKRALDRLCEYGLITVEFRTIKLDNGAVFHNTPFVEPIPSKLKLVTTSIFDESTFEEVDGEP